MHRYLLAFALLGTPALAASLSCEEAIEIMDQELFKGNGRHMHPDFKNYEITSCLSARAFLKGPEYHDALAARLRNQYSDLSETNVQTVATCMQTRGNQYEVPCVPPSATLKIIKCTNDIAIPHRGK